MQTKTKYLAAALVLAAAALPAVAESSIASSASDSLSTSVGSFSKSISGSSEGSSGGEKKVAAGQYRVTEVAAVTEQPGSVRVKLQGAGQAAFTLQLPEAAAQQGQLAVGGQVTAREHAYGMEFAAGPQARAFFLVMHDAWHKELHSQAL